MLATNVVSGSVEVFPRAGCEGVGQSVADLQCAGDLAAASVRYTC